MWTLEFASQRFLPLLPEECQQNPGAYGFELAFWLAQQLLAKGIPTSYPKGEDWGWFIERSDGESEVMVGCGCEAIEGDGYRGQPLKWRVFIKQTSALRKWLSKPAPEFANEIQRALLDVMSEAGIDGQVIEN